MAFSRLICAVLLALAAGLVLSCSEKKEPGRPADPPAAPTQLQFLGSTDNTIDLRWQYNPSANEDGFHVYRRTDSTGSWQLVDTVAANIIQTRITGLEVNRYYDFYVTAFNRDGESGPSNTISGHTTLIQAPDAPTNVAAALLAETVVRVSWRDPGIVDSFLVERRESGSSSWVRLGAVPDAVTAWTDSTVQQETQYIYRIGARNIGGVSWSVESAAINIPGPGAPLPPDSLQTRAYPGVGVRLTWIDRSTNETGYHIRRGRSGDQPVIIDTLAANTTSYFDSIGPQPDAYRYYYVVRAFNELGNSDWSTAASVDYAFCSDGFIPLCAGSGGNTGNFWEYAVDSNEVDFTITRAVYDVGFVDTLDFYLIGEFRGINGRVDSLYYLRNVEGAGTMYTEHPIGIAPPDTLYRHPSAVIQDYYYMNGDCVLVVQSNPFPYTVRGVTYEHVVIYQRFFHESSPPRRIQYYIEPFTVGIVQEKEFIGQNIEIVRDLIDYQVNNQP